jgi:hypothetical protein
LSVGFSVGAAVTVVKGTFITEKRASEIVGPVQGVANGCATDLRTLKEEFTKARELDMAFHRQLVLGLIRARAKAGKRKVDVSLLLVHYDAEIRNGQTPAAAVEHLLLELE